VHCGAAGDQEGRREIGRDHVVDDDVQVAELREDTVDQGVNGSGVADVDRAAGGDSASADDLGHDGDRVLAVDDDDVCAAGGKRKRLRAAEPRCPTGDDCHLAVEIEAQLRTAAATSASAWGAARQRRGIERKPCGIPR
jgi:hypothetical protein